MNKLCIVCRNSFFTKYPIQKCCSQECSLVHRKIWLKEYAPISLEKKRNYARNNREKAKKRHKEYRENNGEKTQLAIIKWRQNNPEKVKSYIKKYRCSEKSKEKDCLFLLRQFYHNICKDRFYYYKCHKEDKNQLRRLTRIMFDEILPNVCEICGDSKHLQIHHKRYDMLNLSSVVRLCDECHKKIRRLNAVSIDEEKIRNRVRHKSLIELKSLFPERCNVCGLEKKLDIHHKIYSSNIKVDDITFICKKCHRNLHKNIINQNIISLLEVDQCHLNLIC